MRLAPGRGTCWTFPRVGPGWFMSEALKALRMKESTAESVGAVARARAAPSRPLATFASEGGTEGGILLSRFADDAGQALGAYARACACSAIGIFLRDADSSSSSTRHGKPPRVRSGEQRSQGNHP